MDILNSILDNIDQSVIIANAQGEMLFFNREAVNIVGTIYAKPMQVGQNVMDLISDDRKKYVEAILSEMQTRKETVKTWAEYTQLNGRTINLELNYIPVLDDDQKVSYVSILARDITSAKVFEKKIRAQAANVENLIKKANAVIMTLDSRGYITNWNEHCTSITGFEKNDVYAKKFVDIILQEKDRQGFENLLERVLKMEAVHNYEVQINTKHGKRLTFLLSATPLLTTNDQAVGINFVGQDITELTEYRRSLEDKIEERTVELRLALQKEKEVVEMKSRFVSIASHEFRTPLSSIQFAANFLKQYSHRIEVEERNQKLDNIVGQVAYMTALLDDVLTYGKNEAGKINLIISTVVMRDFISKIVEEAAHTTKNTHQIETEFQSVPAEIETDEKLLRSIMSNLLTNAIKFSPGKPKVYLRISGMGNSIQIRVRDEGLGIPSDELEKIFEPFLRGKDVADIPGTGLGLSITKKAVELLGGTLLVDSVVSEGATFTVLLPIIKTKR